MPCVFCLLTLDSWFTIWQSLRRQWGLNACSYLMRTSIKLKSYKFQFRHFIALKQLWRCTRLHVMYAFRRLPSHCLFIYIKCFWVKKLQNFKTPCPTNSDTIVSAFIITIRHSEYAPNYSDVTWAPTHRQINCFYNSLLRLISKKTSKLHIRVPRVWIHGIFLTNSW